MGNIESAARLWSVGGSRRTQREPTHAYLWGRKWWFYKQQSTEQQWTKKRERNCRAVSSSVLMCCDVIVQTMGSTPANIYTERRPCQKLHQHKIYSHNKLKCKKHALKQPKDSLPLSCPVSSAHVLLVVSINGHINMSTRSRVIQYLTRNKQILEERLLIQHKLLLSIYCDILWLHT